MKILFVCTGNTCRSPMAAAIMNKIAKQNDMDITADSAGIFVSQSEPASKHAISVLGDMDIDISDYRSKQLDSKLLDDADLILTMTQAHKMVISQLAEDKIFTLAEYVGADEDIDDPYGGDKSDYTDTATQIYELLCDLAEKLEDEQLGN